HLYSKITNPYRKVWVSGIRLGILILLFPSRYGEGYITIQKILDGIHQDILSNSMFSQYSDIGWLVVAFTIVTVFAKSIAALVTLTSGGNGGIFGPSLIMGGLIGFA